ncbi:MAG: hypothetical protein Cons2KO_29100 [Congregibacter sp.]
MIRLFLCVSGLIFLGYGVACALDPQLPARLAGLQIMSGDGYAEMGAMYGGLQTGFGLFCLVAAFSPRLHQSALILLLLCIGCLAILRAGSTLRVDLLVTSYTWAALAFETFVTAVAAWLLLRGNR